MDLISLFFAPPLTSSSSADQEAPPDAVMKMGNGCSIYEAELKGIRERARGIIRKAASAGFGHFPIDRGDLVSRTVSLLTAQAICRTLVTPSGANGINHNDLRNRYKAGSLAPAFAREHGVLATRIPLKASCPAGYDWQNSFFYSGARTCADVTGKIPDDGIPAAMYAVQMSADRVHASLQDLGAAFFYTRYGDFGPVQCGAGTNYVDTYNVIPVSSIWPNLKFVMRGMFGKNWTAWKLLRSCKKGSQKLEASDLMFNFGIRVFIPLGVQVDGRREARTLVISQAAAASTSPLAGLLPANLAFHRFVGSEFAKKLFLEAKHNGWAVTR